MYKAKSRGWHYAQHIWLVAPVLDIFYPFNDSLSTSHTMHFYCTPLPYPSPVSADTLHHMIHTPLLVRSQGCDNRDYCISRLLQCSLSIYTFTPSLKVKSWVVNLCNLHGTSKPLIFSSGPRSSAVDHYGNQSSVVGNNSRTQQQMHLKAIRVNIWPSHHLVFFDATALGMHFY